MKIVSKARIDKEAQMWEIVDKYWSLSPMPYIFINLNSHKKRLKQLQKIDPRVLAFLGTNAIYILDNGRIKILKRSENIFETRTD